MPITKAVIQKTNEHHRLTVRAAEIEMRILNCKNLLRDKGDPAYLPMDICFVSLVGNTNPNRINLSTGATTQIIGKIMDELLDERDRVEAKIAILEVTKEDISHE